MAVPITDRTTERTPDRQPQSRIPRSVPELIGLLRARRDLRPAVLTSVLLRLAELPIRLTADSTTTFFDPNAFVWVRPLEERWRAIRGELDLLLERIDDIPPFEELQEVQRLLTDDGRWKTYMFYGCGYRSEVNCASCPETARLLETIPGLQTALFSILEPGKELPPHRGPYKGVLRYHLGLRIPASDRRCAIRVGDEVRNWEEGASLVFDDSHEHQAWNRTDQVRVVLFVDFLRPLRFPLSLLNACVVKRLGRSRAVREGIAKLESWNDVRSARRIQ